MIADLIRQAAAQLREAGIETPEHDAKLLLAEAVDAELRDIDKAMLMGEGLDSLAPAGGGCRRSRLGVVSDGILARPPSGATRHLPPAGGSQCCCTRLTSESRARATVSGCSTALK